MCDVRYVCSMRTPLYCGWRGFWCEVAACGWKAWMDGCVWMVVSFEGKSRPKGRIAKGATSVGVLDFCRTWTGSGNRTVIVLYDLWKVMR